MQRNVILSVLIGVLAGFALFAALGMANDTHVEAAPEPIAAVAIDQETGLPVGAEQQTA